MTDRADGLDPGHPSDDAPPAADDGDPMASSIRSDEERLREGEGRDPVRPADRNGGAPDPTDAPDLTGAALGRLSRFGLARSIAVTVVALAVFLLAVLSPGRVSPVLGRGLGGLLVVRSVWVAASELGRSSYRLRLLSAVAGTTTIGALLVLDPDRWMRPVGWIVGVVTVVAGIQRLMISRRVHHRISEPPVVFGLALMAGGAVVCLAFEDLFETLVVLGALVAVASGALSVAVRSGFTTVAPSRDRNRPMLVRWIDGRSHATESREAVQDTVFLEGRTAPSRLARFMLLMLFASVISGAGVLADSTAVVIGAMLMAPLITPMMGMGLALVTGWPNRLGRSTLVVLAGSLVGIGTGWLLAASTNVAVDLEANSQIVSRSSPTLIDLVIAVGAGAAGAYALSRSEVSSSLPGVAVAIALVPPLSVIGVTIEGGDWRQASGTLLLFLTNLVAIILAGGSVFVMTGVVPLRRFAEHQHRVRTAFGAVAALAVLVVGALVINGRQIAADALDLDEARTVVADWLGDDSPFEVLSVDVLEGDVSVVLTGPGDPPAAQRLADDLAERLGSDVQLDLQWIPRQREVVSSG